VPLAHSEVNRGYLDHIREWSGERGAGGWTALKHRLLYGRLTRLVFLPFVPLVGVAVLLRVRLALAFRGRVEVDEIHRDAVALSDQFVDQYPLHLYPILAKSLELACLRTVIAPLARSGDRIAEIAVGDGTLSAQVFNAGQRVTALDLSPYSLSKAARRTHIAQAVICDGLNPPLRRGAFDLLIANNFLHHVTQKRQTVLNWSRVATALVFNENTRHWASGWTVPYILKKLGLRSAAERHATTIELLSMQHLKNVNDLRADVQAACRISGSSSFFSERTFFYCSLCSFALRCFGPPTPALWKRLALGPLRAFVRPLTRALARNLILLDAGEPRADDTFVLFVCETGTQRTAGGGDFVCPACAGAVDASDRCTGCGKEYTRADGMLFLLPESLDEVRTSYRPDIARSLPAEHL
jgi:hypothetical protein